MHRLSTHHAWSIITLTALVLSFSLLFMRGVHAEDVQTGQGIVCDTPEQVAKFATEFRGDIQATLAVTNGDIKPTPCGVLAIAYVRGERIAVVDTKEGTAEIVKIAIVAINVGMGWQVGPPMTQYTLFLIQGRDA